MVLQRGYEDKRKSESKSDGSDESAESERKSEGLGAMEFWCARSLLCVRCGWVAVFVSLA